MFLFCYVLCSHAAILLHCDLQVFNVLVEAVNRSDTSDALLEGVDEDLNEEDMPGTH